MTSWHGGVLRAAGMAATVVITGACTGTGGGTAATQAPPTRAPVPPVSPQDYREGLTAATDSLDSALSALAKAKGLKVLPDRISDLQDAAANAATALEQRVRAPSAVAGEHKDLAVAVRRFGEELGTLSDDVDGQNLCTAAAVRAELGRAEGTTALREAVEALGAKAAEYEIPLALPAAEKARTRRLQNGRFVRSGGRGGRGTLTIDNGSADDAVITLAKGKRPVISVYVRKGRTFTVNGVSDGTYRVFFTGGVDWDGKARAFTRDCTFERFDDSLAFRTSRTASLITWSTWDITLHSVPGGNALTSDVDPEDFPAA